MTCKERDWLTAAEAAMLDRLATHLRREAARSERQATRSRVALQLEALAQAVAADAEDLAEGRDHVA